MVYRHTVIQSPLCYRQLYVAPIPSHYQNQIYNDCPHIGPEPVLGLSTNTVRGKIRKWFVSEQNKLWMNAIEVVARLKNWCNI